MGGEIYNIGHPRGTEVKWARDFQFQLHNKGAAIPHELIGDRVTISSTSSSRSNEKGFFSIINKLFAGNQKDEQLGGLF